MPLSTCQVFFKSFLTFLDSQRFCLFLAFAYIDGDTGPTFILHAQFDELIPLDQADVLLKNLGARRKEMVVVPGAGHNDIIFSCGRAYFETIARFANSLKKRGKD